MPVSKRLRYEVLRRDGHACRYCGATAPEVKLTVDHVVPVALGGTDQPDNLVTACADCNSGKSATPPSSALIADVSAETLRFKTYLDEAMKILMAEHSQVRDYVDAVGEHWHTWVNGLDEPFPLPSTWEESAEAFFKRSVPLELIRYAIDKSTANSRIGQYDKWRYMCGIVWRTLDDQLEVARQIQTAVEEATNGA